MKAYCANCGTKHLQGAAYCIMCGAPVDGDGGLTQQVQPTHRTAPGSEMSASTTSAVEGHQPNPGERTEPSSNKDESSREDRVVPYGMARVLRDMLEPFVWVEEKAIEPFAAWLRRLALLDVLEYLGKLTILVVVLLWLMESDDRAREEHYEAWRMITAAQGQEGTGGRIDALQNLYWDKQSLQGLTARNANLDGIDLYKEGKGGAQIGSADLEEAGLEGADLYRANLSSTNLRGTDLKEAKLGRSDLLMADLREADLTKAELAEADFSNVSEAANLDDAVLDQARLNGADLRGTSLENASLWKTKLNGAKLNNANLEGAYLEDADLQGANLKGAEFFNADIRGANLKATNVTFQQLDEAIGDKATKIPDKDASGNDLERPSDWELAELSFPRGYKLLPGSGREFTGQFSPTLSLDVDSPRWRVPDGESVGYFAVTRDRFPTIRFLSLDGVYNPQHPTEDSVSAPPEDLVGWLEKHPHVRIISRKNVIVGGVRGVRLDVTIPTAPEDYPPDCLGPCVYLFRSIDGSRVWSYSEASLRYYILDVGYETVVIQVEFSNSDDLQEAQELLDSVRFSAYDVATGQIFSGGFKPSLTFTVAGQGWWMVNSEPDIWTMEKEAAYLSFLRVDEVYDPQNPSDETVTSAPKDLIAWIEKHPRLKIVDKPKKVTVGGVRGVQLEVLVSSAAEGFCDGCVPLFKRNSGYFELYTDSRNQLTILQVGGETVVISVASPTSKFEDFRHDADEVISSVTWRD